MNKVKFHPDFGLLVLRIMVGVIFIYSGIGKFQNGLDSTGGGFSNLGIPFAEIFAWVVTIVETVGGLLIILGPGARISAALLSCVMTVAFFTVQLPKGFRASELVLMLLAGLIAIIFQGTGKFSLGNKTRDSKSLEIRKTRALEKASTSVFKS